MGDVHRARAVAVTVVAVVAVAVVVVSRSFLVLVKTLAICTVQIIERLQAVVIGVKAQSMGML